MNYSKPSLIRPDGDPFESVEGFNFNRNDFEDLIDNFTPPEYIPTLLQVSTKQLDDFCNVIYNMNFKQTYDVLYQRAQLYYRKAMLMLSKSGNPTAIKVSSEYYVGLGRVAEEDNSLTIVNVMPQTESDLDKLNKEDKK